MIHKIVKKCAPLKSEIRKIVFIIWLVFLVLPIFTSFLTNIYEYYNIKDATRCETCNRDSVTGRLAPDTSLYVVVTPRRTRLYTLYDV